LLLLPAFLALPALPTDAQQQPADTAAPVAKPAGKYRYQLAMLQSWSAKSGFNLLLETSTDTRNIPADKLKLNLQVGDGKSWRFLSQDGPWKPGHDYRVRAVISPSKAELFIDGKSVAVSPGGFIPKAGEETDVVSGLPYKAITGDPEFVVRVSALKILAGDQTISADLPDPDATSLPLFLFDPQAPARLPVSLNTGDSVTIETTFRVVPAPAISEIAPFVDRYGQAVHANWDKKVTADEQLKAFADEEAERYAQWGLPTDRDAYGGYTASPWKEEPTGFYKIARRNGFDFLISPEGNPVFYTGVDTAPGVFERTFTGGREFLYEWLPPREGQFADAWTERGFSFPIANLIRKYGQADWAEQHMDSLEERIRHWGFCGVAKWSGDTRPGLPRQPVVRRSGVPKIVKMPDIFDVEVQSQFRETIRKNIEPQKGDPTVVGWSLGNEHEEIVLRSEITAILAKPATLPAKKAIIAHALKTRYDGDVAALAKAWQLPPAVTTIADLESATNAKAPAADIEAMRLFFADAYYGFVYRTFKEIDPNHLYFGFWIVHGWWESEADWHVMAKHVDVVGFDYYDREFQKPDLLKLIKQTGKPALIGEFSFPIFAKGYAANSSAVYSEAEAGELYAKWLEATSSNPHIVGVEWFQYRDQALTGRDAGEPNQQLTRGEHWAFGMVDTTDRPKWPLLERVREANLSAIKRRLELAK
jgi:hypothetical protein